MVKGKPSATAASRSGSSEFIDSRIDLFKQGDTFMYKQNLREAMAAKAMLGTGKPKVLAASNDLKELEHDIGAAYGGSRGFHTLSNIESLESAGIDERPLGMPKDMWPKIKARAQSELANLHALGFTNAEIAAFINYREYLL